MDDYEEKIKKARNRVLRLLTYRARCVAEIRADLERKLYTPEVIEAVIAEMLRYGYLNDESFAAEYVEYRKLRGYGPKRVRYELIARGLDKEIVDAQLEEKFDEEEDLARMRSMLQRRIEREAEIDNRWLQRQAAFLQRRGFQDGLIMTVLKEYEHHQ